MMKIVKHDIEIVQQKHIFMILLAVQYGTNYSIDILHFRLSGNSTDINSF